MSHTDETLQIPRAASPIPSTLSPSASSQRLHSHHSPSRLSRDHVVVFSGGSAANSLVDVFERVRRANRSTLSYVIPISDNGGSTSEIIRVFGGPGTFQPYKVSWMQW